MRFDVFVTIGGGLSGLVTACRAAQQLGQRVAALEQGSE